MAARRRLSDSPVLITHGRLSESPIMVALGASPVRGGMGESPLERQFIRMAMTDCKFECEHFQRSCALVVSTKIRHFLSLHTLFVMVLDILDPLLQ